MSVSQPSKYVQNELRLPNMLREGSVTRVKVYMCTRALPWRNESGEMNLENESGEMSLENES